MSVLIVYVTTHTEICYSEISLVLWEEKLEPHYKHADKDGDNDAYKNFAEVFNELIDNEEVVLEQGYPFSQLPDEVLKRVKRVVWL